MLGTLLALALLRYKFFGRDVISLLVILPIALPGIITGISLRSAFNLADIPFSFWTIVLGHATFCVVVVYNNAVARFRRVSASLVEASMDLGANGFQTFAHVILPNIATALLAGGMLAFALLTAGLAASLAEPPEPLHGGAGRAGDHRRDVAAGGQARVDLDDRHARGRRHRRGGVCRMVSFDRDRLERRRLGARGSGGGAEADHDDDAREAHVSGGSEFWGPDRR